MPLWELMKVVQESIFCATCAGAGRKQSAQASLPTLQAQLALFSCLIMFRTVSLLNWTSQLPQGELGAGGEVRGVRGGPSSATYPTALLSSLCLERTALGHSKQRKGSPNTQDDEREKGKPFTLWICQTCFIKKAQSYHNKPTVLLPKLVLIAELGFKQPE